MSRWNSCSPYAERRGYERETMLLEHIRARRQGWEVELSTLFGLHR